MDVYQNSIILALFLHARSIRKSGVPEENHQPAASHWQTLSHNVASSTPRYERDLNSQL